MKSGAAPHPLVRLGRIYLVLAVFAVVLTLGSLSWLDFETLLPSTVLLEGAIVGLGGLLAWNGLALLGLGRIMPFLTSAATALAAGRLEEVEAILARVPRAIAESATGARRLGYYRAMAAMLRGDPRAAIAFAEPALSERTNPFTKAQDLTYRTDTLALRAFAHAACGDAAAAIRDASEVESSAYARAPALGRAALARAAVFARSDDKAALAALLDAHGSLVMTHGTRRERALVRALRELARSSGRSVYREPVRPGTEAGAPLRAWASGLVPQAAEFMPEQEAFVPVEQAQPQIDPAALHHIAQARIGAGGVPRTGAGKKVIALWAVLVVMFLSIWQFLTPAKKTVAVPVLQEPPPAPDPSTLSSLAPALFVIGVSAICLIFILVRHNRLVRAYYAGELAAARRDDAGALARFERLAKKRRTPALVALAHLGMTAVFSRAGDFLRAIAVADRGLAVIARYSGARALTADTAGPGLLAERAFALAALGRMPEAETELANMFAQSPTYPLGEAAVLRVRLVGALRSGQLAEAVRLATSRTQDLILDLESDLLADVTLVAGGAADRDFRDRVLSELGSMPQMRGWIQSVAGACGPQLGI